MAEEPSVTAYCCNDVAKKDWLDEAACNILHFGTSQNAVEVKLPRSHPT